MASIDRWVLVDEEGTEADYEFTDYELARQNAEHQGHAVIERHYVYEDSDLVWTPDGGGTWPSGKGATRCE